MKHDEDPTQFFRNLGRFLADDEGMTREQVREELREEGIDPDAVVARIHALVDRAEQEERVARKLTVAEVRAAGAVIKEAAFRAGYRAGRGDAMRPVGTPPLPDEDAAVAAWKGAP